MCSKCFFIEGDFCSSQCREMKGKKTQSAVQTQQISQLSTEFTQPTQPIQPTPLTTETSSVTEPIAKEPIQEGDDLDNLLDSLIEEDLGKVSPEIQTQYQYSKPQPETTAQTPDEPYIPTYQQVEDQIEYQNISQPKPAIQPEAKEYHGTFKQVENQIDYKPAPPEPQTNLLINNIYTGTHKQEKIQSNQPPTPQQKETNLLTPKKYMGPYEQINKEIGYQTPETQSTKPKVGEETYKPSFLQVDQEIDQKLQSQNNLQQVLPKKTAPYEESELTFKKIDAMMADKWKQDETVITDKIQRVKKKPTVPTSLTFQQLDAQREELLAEAAGKTIPKKKVKLQDTARYAAKDWIPVKGSVIQEITDDYKNEIKDFIPENLKGYKRKLEITDDARYQAKDYIPYTPVKKEVSDNYKYEIKDFVPEEIKGYKRKLDLKDDAREQAQDYIPYKPVEKKFSDDYKEEIKDFIPEEYKNYKKDLKFNESYRYSATDYIPKDIKLISKKNLELKDEARYSATDYIPEELKYKRKLELKDDAREKAKDYIPEELKYKRKLELKDDARYAAENYVPPELAEKRKLELKDTARYVAKDYIPPELSKKRQLKFKDDARYAAEDYIPDYFATMKKHVMNTKGPTFLKVDEQMQKEWRSSGLISEVKKSELKSYFDQMQELSLEKGTQYVGLIDEKGEERIFQLETKKPKDGLLTEKPYMGRSKEDEMERYKKERMQRIELYEFLMVLGEILFHPTISEDYLIKKEKEEELKKIKEAPTFLKLDRDLSEADLKKLKEIEKNIEEEEKKKDKGPKLL